MDFIPKKTSSTNYMEPSLASQAKTMHTTSSESCHVQSALSSFSNGAVWILWIIVTCDEFHTNNFPFSLEIKKGAGMQDYGTNIKNVWSIN